MGTETPKPEDNYSCELVEDLRLFVQEEHHQISLR